MFKGIQYLRKLASEAGPEIASASFKIPFSLYVAGGTLAIGGAITWLKQDINEVRGKVEKVHEKVNDVGKEVSKVRQEVSDLRADVHKEVFDLRADVHKEVSDLRAEMYRGFTEIHKELAEMKILFFQQRTGDLDSKTRSSPNKPLLNPFTR